ncbi:hypothetical protein O3G_MSEX008270 [Manduca sexta]|uniref:Uncharacterized protein n=1 Tax=Manduca sexta TaxID=7130 RepID=A0A922CPA5_MANSE|nr:hypothetical protein O3G_MSEX008270 [Manduca sexta]
MFVLCFRLDNVYTCRGNLGFAIMKIHKSGLHNIILYDSRKITLSITSIIPTLEVIINKNQSISYYDDFRKYWSLYVNEDSLHSITSLLKSFNTQIKMSSHTDKNPPEPIIENNKTNTEDIKKDIGSDTDSSINRKTKMSILNRMANMGQSVLPTNVNFNENTSDSSDTSENITHTKTFRHKPIKNIRKDMSNERNTVVCTPQKMCESEQNQVAISTQKVSDNTALYTYVNGVLVPVTSANLMSNSIDRNINNMELYFNEQRMNNTEMRINVNRITDKVDHVLQKLNNLEEKETSGGSAINMQISVYQKLLLEYENKIKMYENLLKNKGLETKTSNEDTNNEMEKKMQELKLNITKLEQENQEKADEISKLGNELKVLQQKVDTSAALRESTDIMLNKIKDLELAVSDKDLEVRDVMKKYENLLQSKNEYNIEEKIKSIMNNTYQTISGNFHNNESYSGEKINKIIAVVIRNITLHTLNMLNDEKNNS